MENINTWEGLDTHGGSYIHLIDNYIKQFGTIGVLVAGQTRGSLPFISNHMYVERNIIEQPTSGWVTGNEHAFIVQYPQGAYYALDMYIRNNTLFYTTRPTSGSSFEAIRAGGVNGMTISGNKIYNGPTASGEPAIYVYFNDGTYGNNNLLISNNFINQWGASIEIQPSSVTGSISIVYNIIRGEVDAILMMGTGDIPSTGILTVYNNVLTQAGGYSNIFELTNGIASGGSFIVKNNIIGYLTNYPGLYWYLSGGTIAGTFISDYNLYWNSNSGSPFNFAGASKTLSQWQALGYDTHGQGVSVDPKFLNAGGSYPLDTDFKLQNSSPAINAGTNVGLTQDYLGNPINGTVDIGAIELQ